MPAQGVDLAPAFALVVLLFVAFATYQFSHSWNDAQAGLLLYEKTCPLNAGAADRI